MKTFKVKYKISAILNKILLQIYNTYNTATDKGVNTEHFTNIILFFKKTEWCSAYKQYLRSDLYKALQNSVKCHNFPELLKANVFDKGVRMFTPKLYAKYTLKFQS